MHVWKYLINRTENREPDSISIHVILVYKKKKKENSTYNSFVVPCINLLFLSWDHQEN